MTTSSEITAKFLEVFEAFKIIENQPTDLVVNRIFKVLSRILYVIECDEENAEHKIIGLIKDEQDYYNESV